MKAFAEKTKQLMGARKDPVFDDEETLEAYTVQKEIQFDLRRLLDHLDALAKAAEVYAAEGRAVLEVFEDVAPKWQRHGFDEVARVLRGSVGLLRQSQALNLQLEQEVTATVARPIRDLLEGDCARAKASVKKTQEQRAQYQEVVAAMDRERKKGKVTQLDSENQVKRAAAEYTIIESECKKALRTATRSSQTCTVVLSCNYLKAYQGFWDKGARMREVLEATISKNRIVGSDMAERAKEDDARVHTVFGVGLDEVFARDGRLPPFVFELISYITTYGLSEEGIFRVPGNMEAMQQWKRKIDSGVHQGMTSEILVLDAAGLLKLYLRELPTPLIPFDVFNDLMALDLSAPGRANSESQRATEAEIMACLARLPAYTHHLLKSIVQMCVLIASKSNINKMDASNVARSIAPGLMRSEVQDPSTILALSHKSNELFTLLIERYQLFFEKSLHATAASGNVARMRDLIQKDGLGVAGRDDAGKTVLHYAAAAGQLDMCRFLVESFPEMSLDSVDADGYTAVHRAVQNGRLETAAFLLSRGANAEIMTKGGVTVWASASRVSPTFATEVQELARTYRKDPSAIPPPQPSNFVSSPRSNTNAPPVTNPAPVPIPKSQQPRPLGDPAYGRHNASSPAIVYASSSSISSSSSSSKVVDESPPHGGPASLLRASGSALPAAETSLSTTSASGGSAAPPPPIPNRRNSRAFSQPPVAPKPVVPGLDEDPFAETAEPALPPLRSPAKAATLTAPQRLSTLPKRLSEADPHGLLWKTTAAESFYDIAPLTNAVLTFSALVCDAARSEDRMAVGQSLKDIARGMQSFFKALEPILGPFAEEDARVVRAAAVKLKGVATELLRVVKNIAQGGDGTSEAEHQQQRTALAVNSFALSTVTLEVFDSIELGRYRLINTYMQRTGETAAGLSKSNTNAEVQTQRAALKEVSSLLGSALVTRGMKLTSESFTHSVLRSTAELMQDVLAMRDLDAAPSDRGRLAKSVILNFRKIKAIFKDADESTENESRTDEVIFSQLCAQLEEVRAPDDYQAANEAERELLNAVAELHNMLLKKRDHFGRWDAFVQHFEDILASLSNISTVIRRLRMRATAPETVTKISFYVNALEYHQARVTLVMAHASIRSHNTHADRDEEVRSQAYPPLHGYTRPGIAMSGVVQLLLNLIPVVYQITH